MKTGAKLSFFIGIVAGIAVMFANQSPSFEAGGYFATLILCLIGGTVLYVPLNLGVVATSRQRGFLHGLLRFLHGLAVFVGVAAIVLVSIGIAGTWRSKSPPGSQTADWL